jgi:hypothetical protein
MKTKEQKQKMVENIVREQPAYSREQLLSKSVHPTVERINSRFLIAREVISGK